MSSDMKDTEPFDGLVINGYGIYSPSDQKQLAAYIKRETDKAVMGELQDMLAGYKLALKDEPTDTLDVFAPILHVLDHRITQLKQQQTRGDNEE